MPHIPRSRPMRHLRCDQIPLSERNDMKNLLAIPFVALLIAGCADYSVEPRSVIRIDRSATSSAVARQDSAPNTQADDPADLGVAPYITPPALGSAAAGNA